MISFHLARADNGVIGVDGRLPWHLPADLKRFKAQTLGRPGSGAEIFALFTPDRIELTEVHVDALGDTRVPDFAGWREVAREDRPAMDGRPAYSFVTLLPPVESTLSPSPRG